MTSRALGAVSLALAALAAGCATEADERALRRPALPPAHVALAERHEALFRSVAIYEVLGAPEFRLFDGDDLITTRPTRRDVVRTLSAWLSEAELLAPDLASAHYLLTVNFEGLRGPDVIPFTDKHARANVRYTLTDLRTRAIVFDGDFESAFQARMPGVTEEALRAAIAGGVLGAIGVGLINDGHDEIDAQAAMIGLGPGVGAGAARFASEHEGLLNAWPVLRFPDRFEDGADRGLVLGLAGAVLAEISPGNLSEVEAGMLGGAVGALSGLAGAASIGLPPEHFDSKEAIGAFDGTRRRRDAVHWMMRQSFDHFLWGLDSADLIRPAVACSDLNGDGPHQAVLLSTADAIAWNCSVRPQRRRLPRWEMATAPRRAREEP